MGAICRVTLYDQSIPNVSSILYISSRQSDEKDIEHHFSEGRSRFRTITCKDDTFGVFDIFCIEDLAVLCKSATEDIKAIFNSPQVGSRNGVRETFWLLSPL